MKPIVCRTVAAMVIVLQATGGLAVAQQRQPVRDAVARATFQAPAKPDRSDPGTEGAAIGALVGGGIMATFFIVSFKKCGPGCENDLPGGLPAFGVGVGAAAGATAGFFVDKAIGRKQRIAIAPSVTPKERRLKVAWRF